MEALTPPEQELRTKTEQSILSKAHSIGAELIILRDNRLYRSTHDTFEAYCEETFGYTRRLVDYQIKFSQIKLGPGGDIVQNEGQARALTAVPEEKREKVASELKASGRPITAATISNAAKNENNRSQMQKEEKPTFRDKTGYAVPEQWVPLFEREPEVAELRRKISEVRSSLRKSSENGDILWAPVSISIVLSELDAVYASLDDAIPYAVCAFCQGVTFKQCRVCKGRGVISRRIYKDTVPDELKAIRDTACVKP